jgi:hypothetical protein
MVFFILKVILSIWLILIFLKSLSNDMLSLVLFDGMIGASLPLALLFAWTIGPLIFNAVMYFSLFILMMIAIHMIELFFG